MKNLDQFLEVIITKKDNVFKAECPSFPRCKGIGETEEKALDKLSNSIGNYIGRASKKQFNEILTGKNYTEIVVDPKDRDSFQHRLFSVVPEEKKKPNVLVKFDALSVTNSKDAEDSLLNEIEELLSSSAETAESSSSLLTKQRPQSPLFSESPTIITERDGSIGFGIPICLN